MSVAPRLREMPFGRLARALWTLPEDARLAAPRALAFLEELGVERLHAYQTRLVQAGSAALQNVGAVPVAPSSAGLAMRAFLLPQTRGG